jgi:hypothetical protein
VSTVTVMLPGRILGIAGIGLMATVPILNVHLGTRYATSSVHSLVKITAVLVSLVPQLNRPTLLQFILSQVTAVLVSLVLQLMSQFTAVKPFLYT